MTSSIQCKQIEIKWVQNFYSPIVASFADVGSYPIYAPDTTEQLSCLLDVMVQGNLEDAVEQNKPVFLTVHDVGKTYLSFVDLVNHPAMVSLKERAVFLHIAVPGQEPGAKDFEGVYPSMDQLGEGLAQLMDKLKLSNCIAIGEGAGADIACRFAMNNAQLVTGLVLIHCTSTTHGIIANIKEAFANLRLADGEMNHSAWNWLLVHKYGNHDMDGEQRKYLEGFKKDEMNERNLSRYLHSFSRREDFTDQLKDRLAKLLAIDVQLVTGGKAPHNENMLHMYGHMCKSKTGMLVAEAVVDVLAETPEQVAAAIILLCHRQALFADVQLLPAAGVSSKTIK